MSEEFDDISQEEIDKLLKILDEIPDDKGNIDYDFIMDNYGLDIKEIEDDMENYVPTLDLEFMKTNTDAITPSYSYKSDSGFDLYSTEEQWIFGFDRSLIPTGLHMSIPEGYEIQVRSKSGLALKQGLMVLNSPGTVDQGYTGEIQVIMFNTTKDKIKIEKGQKIAQAVLCPVVSGKWVNLVEKNKLEEKDRNSNGFGSTGL
jgi:dUTP pyrophosphatase